MIPFLKHVADDLRKKAGNDLSRIAVVFPNKRASLFLNEYLAAEDTVIPPVIWSPRYMTISEFFTSISPFRLADPIETVCRIYRLYVKLTGSRETLDFFYGWGEKLLADFDDADKNMADAKRLFRNLAEIKQIETGEYIDEEKERVLQGFFADFSLKENSQIREKFLELWNVMHPLYTRLNEELAKEGLAYEGALYRNVTEALTAESGDKTLLPAHIDKYVFVGFNVLDKVEETLFTHLRQKDKAMFYWDYDLFYCQPPVCVPEYGRAAQRSDGSFEAGTFLRNNLAKFPNELSPEFFDNLRQEKDLEFVSAPTEAIQARSVAGWLNTRLTADEKQTAIVLCNESLLQPILHALPPGVKEANITKGYPLHHTIACRTVERAMNGLAEDTKNLSWIDQVAELVKTEATAVSQTPDSLDKTLNTEAYFQTYTTLGRFRRLITDGWLNVEAATLHKLLRQVLHSMSIPFHGEPAAGLQVMGVLETRNLDFRNILMLSVNEGNLPHRVNESSFIPHALRREFGLTTARHKTAVYAYYFYRLIQRAEHVRFVYNCSTGNGAAGEMSRFMTQLLIETNHPIRRIALTNQQATKPVKTTAIPKPSNLPEVLKRLSPSAINTYLRCPVQFYFQRVARLKTPQPEANIIEPNTLGSVFHRTAELFYADMKQRAEGWITPQMLAPYLETKNDVLLLHYVRRAMEDEKVPSNPIVETTVKKYFRQLLRGDARLGNFRIIATETPRGLQLSVPYKDGNAEVEIAGTIDRMDLVTPPYADEETIRVVDYKTGGEPEKAASMEQLFTPAPRHPHYILQTFIYSLLLTNGAKQAIQPTLFFVHKAAEENYSPAILFEKNVMKDFRKIAGDFQKSLVQLVAEILNPDTTFEPTPTTDFCRTCPYVCLCRR